MQPTIRWMKPWENEGNNETNDLEDLFEQFAFKWGIAWRRESRFFYEYDPNLPAGHLPRGYCPDYYLIKYRVYVEIYEGEKSDANRAELAKKRKRIRWLSAYTNCTVVLIHLSNWPVDLADLKRLIKRAKKEANRHRQEARQTGAVYELPARRKRPKHRRNKSATNAAQLKEELCST